MKPSLLVKNLNAGTGYPCGHVLHICATEKLFLNSSRQIDVLSKEFCAYSPFPNFKLTAFSFTNFTVLSFDPTKKNNHAFLCFILLERTGVDAIPH